MASETEKTALEQPAQAESGKGEPNESFVEAVLGRELLQSRWLKRLWAVPVTYRVVGGIALLAALLYIPYLGAVGLWDPWETHYGEVGREMIQRRPSRSAGMVPSRSSS